MKKRIVSLLCAGLLVFSEPYPALAAQSAGTEAVLENAEGAPPGTDEDSRTGYGSISEHEKGPSSEKAIGSDSGTGAEGAAASLRSPGLPEISPVSRFSQSPRNR